jgi:hypothetical protein
VRTDLTSSEAIAYAIADNRTAELAEWDDDVLAAQLNGLLAEDEELLASAGFTDEELEELLNEPSLEENQSSAEEVDVDGMEMECTCPRCGFEFDPK